MQEFTSKKLFESLISDQIAENQFLEFKAYHFPLGKIESKVKEELAKDIVAMANAEGGQIILGISESDKGVATEVIGTGCPLSKFDDVQMAIKGVLMAKVRPRLHGISMQPIELSKDNIAIVLKYPRALLARML